MKRTLTTYHCDVCSTQIDECETQDDFEGVNFGLCEECRQKDFGLEVTRLRGGGVSIEVIKAGEGEAAAPGPDEQAGGDAEALLAYSNPEISLRYVELNRFPFPKSAAP